MTGFPTLLRKELVWQWRSYRLLAVGAVFLILGISTPILDHFLPSIVASSSQSGVIIQLPEYTSGDVIRDYYGNITQLGMIAVILMGMGAIASERASGTAVMTLSKPVGFESFVLAKYAGLFATLLVASLAGAIAVYFYTSVLFGTYAVGGFLGASGLYFLYLNVVLAITLLASALVRSQLVAGVGALVALIVLLVLGAIPSADGFLPGGLTGWAGALLGAKTGAAHWGALVVGLGIVVGGLGAATHLLRSREL